MFCRLDWSMNITLKQGLQGGSCRPLQVLLLCYLLKTQPLEFDIARAAPLFGARSKLPTLSALLLTFLLSESSRALFAPLLSV